MISPFKILFIIIFVMVMRNPMVKKVLLIELTVPWDSQSSFKAAFERKTSRYAQLALDLEDKEWRVSNLSLEIGTRGSVAGMDAPPRGAPPRGAKGVPRPAPRRKKRLLPRPAPQNTIAAQPRPAPPVEVVKLRGVCGAK